LPQARYDPDNVFRSPRGDRYVDARVAKSGEAIAPVEFPDVAVDVALVLGES
jgi:hypothetical protein